jgi:hypothetical protein
MLVGSSVMAANPDEIHVVGHPEIDGKTVSTAAIVISVIMLILMLVFLTFNIIFLVGVHKVRYAVKINLR